jgi:hypothetical protein
MSKVQLPPVIWNLILLRLGNARDYYRIAFGLCRYTRRVRDQFVDVVRIVCSATKSLPPYDKTTCVSIVWKGDVHPPDFSICSSFILDARLLPPILGSGPHGWFPAPVFVNNMQIRFAQIERSELMVGDCLILPDLDCLIYLTEQDLCYLNDTSDSDTLFDIVEPWVGMD